MKFRTLIIVGFAFGFAACADKEQPAPTEGDGGKLAAESTAAEPVAEEQAEVGTEAFVKHMHNHASQLKRLNVALEAGDLEAALTPAYWLSQHEGATGAPENWQPHMQSMRDAAGAVSNAADLEAARVAAEGIADGCRGCHIAAWVDVPDLLPN